MMFDDVNDSIVVDASSYQMMIDEIKKLEADKARLVEALKAAQVSINRLTSDESSTQQDFDNEDLISCVLEEMRGNDGH